MNTHNEIRAAVAMSIRAMAMQWRKRSQVCFTGLEVAETLEASAQALEDKVKKETTIIKPGE